jgi:glycosyltransferase involved in cell wall biosynthesis
MKKTVLVRGPALTQSGYGEHTRFVLRALRLQEDHLDIHVLPVSWGETGWLSIDDEERRWIDSRIEACKNHMNAKLPYDISVQVTIPNEWQCIAPISIGVTAGIETNKVAPIWIQKANEMDKVIVVSEHAKKGFTDVVYHGHNPSTGQPVELRCTTPIEVAHYPVKAHQAPVTPILELDYDFNFLAVAQWGPRKNVANLIKWFVEENMDQEVGLVLKTSIKNNSYVDREHMEQLVRSCVPDIPERKCKVYLLHGDLTEVEMHSLYVHPKIKAMVSLAHGEGFGLPLFEAAYSGLPIIAPGWSGQVDFLYAPFESKSKKNKDKEVLKPHFAEIDFTMGPVPQETIWQGVIEKDMVWCYPTEGSFKLRMRQVRNNYDKWLEKARRLQQWVLEEFGWDKKHQKLTHFCYDGESEFTDVNSWLEELKGNLVEHD